MWKINKKELLKASFLNVVTNYHYFLFYASSKIYFCTKMMFHVQHSSNDFKMYLGKESE